MRLSKLTLQNFRGFPNGRETIFDLDHSVVLLNGRNGMGKTSTLDAIELAATGRIRRFSRFDLQAVSQSLINADAQNSPATIQLMGVNGEPLTGEIRISAGPNDFVRPMLSKTQITAFDSTSYLTQSEIRRIVTLDSASLGQLVRSLIADETIDIVIEALAGANINRTNRTYQAVKAQFKLFEDSVSNTTSELEMKETLFHKVQPATTSLGSWAVDITGLASTLNISFEAPKDLQSAENSLKTINNKVQDELRAALSKKSMAEDNLKWCEQLQTEENIAVTLKAELKSSEGKINARKDELKQIQENLQQEQRKLDDARTKLMEHDALRGLLETVLSSPALLQGDICPICDQPLENLKEHVESKRIRLSSVGSELTSQHDRLQNTLKQLRASEQQAQSGLQSEISTNHSIQQQLSNIENNTQALLVRIGAHEKDLESVVTREKITRDAASTQVEALTKLSARAGDLLAKLSSAVIQQADTIRTLETLRKRRSVQLRQLEAARAKKEQLDTFIDAVQRLRKELEEHAEEILKAFTLKDVQQVFTELFTRLARNPPFQVGFTEARVMNHKPRIEWKAMRNNQKYEGELIFSQGELNASALSMFLALASTYKHHLKVLLLDDPIQSMDEVHIEELGEVLKACKDELGWQIFISLHDEAAFKYFRRQLTPSLQNQSLISYTLERSATGIQIHTDGPQTFNEQIFKVAAS
jgi:exonuclease SbcC